MAKLKKGSAAAKAFMAKIRAAKGKSKPAAKKVGAVKKVVPTKKATSMHKDTKSHNVNIRVMSGTKKTKKYSIGKVNYTKLLTDIAKESKLNAAVIRSIKSAAKDYGTGGDAIKSYINDVLSGGGQSGIINELIYYSDTTAWYKKYTKEITKLLEYFMLKIGVDHPIELFGNKWDKTDPLAIDTQNQNLLAWFSYEETCREIANRLGFDL